MLESSWAGFINALGVQEKNNSAVSAPAAAATATEKGENSRLVVVKQMHRHDRTAGQQEADVSSSSSQQPGKQVRTGHPQYECPLL